MGDAVSPALNLAVTVVVVEPDDPNEQRISRVLGAEAGAERGDERHVDAPHLDVAWRRHRHDRARIALRFDG